jgi:hypothetical protein
MTFHGTDLILTVAVLVVGVAASYFLLLHKVRQILTERQLTIADQLGALDDAIRSLETRLAASSEPMTIGFNNAAEHEVMQESAESQNVAPEIQAAIAAAALATLGQHAVVRTVKNLPSAWSQQGRSLVQAGHNARARR